MIFVTIVVQTTNYLKLKLELQIVNYNLLKKKTCNMLRALLLMFTQYKVFLQQNISCHPQMP